MTRIFLVNTSLILVLVLSGCATHKTSLKGGGDSNFDKVLVEDSYLKIDKELSGQPESLENASDNSAPEEDRRSGAGAKGSSARLLKTLNVQTEAMSSVPLLNSLFSEDEEVRVTAEKMPLVDFIHYVFGDLFEVNYIVDESVESGGDSQAGADVVTMNIATPVSERELFDLVSNLFVERGINIKHGSGTFFLYRSNEQDSGPQVAIGIGRNQSTVPKTSQRILQVIPIRFGLRGSLERTLRSLIDASITPDFDQSTIFVEGTRQEIVRAIELIEMLDIPATRGRYIGFAELDYVSPDDLAGEVKTLLGNEGIDASIGAPNQKSVVMVPLRRMGAVVVFATSEFLLERVNYWIRLTDVPAMIDAKQYFVYKPVYTRAKDLAENIAHILDIKPDTPLSSSESTGQGTGNAPSSMRSAGGGSKDMRMVVDERSNAIIFHSTASRYRSVKELLTKLDTPPRQVMLDITIAEVSLKDEFKYGVEWALRRSEVTLTTSGAWGAADIGGLGVIIDGKDGPVNANLLANNSLVHVLSNPSMMVVDGVAASISVGSQISVVGETSSDPNGERITISTDYRNTGLNVIVTPTINSEGVITMEIAQTISNSLPGSGAGGNPDIFNRSLSTMVVSESGQTVMLAGLISSSRTTGGGGTPFLKDIPILGGLFKANSESEDRTELVMMITPRVLDNISDWDLVLADFNEGLKYLRVK